MQKRSFLRKSAVSLAATLGMGTLGSVASAQITLPPNLTIGVQTITPNVLNGAYYDPPANPPEASFNSVAGIRTLEASYSAVPQTMIDLNVDLNFDQGAGNNPPFFPLNTNDSLASVWSGEIVVTPAAAGTYRFDSASDDGTVGFIDGQYIVRNNFYQGRTRRNFSFELTPGVHEIVMGWYEGGSGANGTFWLYPEGSPERILNPASPPTGITFRKVTYNTDTSRDNQNVTVNDNATLTVHQDRTVPMGTLTVADGKTFTVDTPVATTTFTQTTIGAVANLAVEGRGTVVTGPLLSAGAVTSINKSGSGTLTVPTRAGSTVTSNPAINVTGGTLDIAVAGGNTSVGTGDITLDGGTLALSNDAGVPSQAGVFSTIGDFYRDDNIFDPIVPLLPDNASGVGWTGLESKAQFDAKLAAATPNTTVPVNLAINFPRGDANPANGGTNDIAEALFDVDGANLGVGLTGNDDFVARFTGKLNVTAAGATPFLLMSNDGAAMFIDLDQGPGQNWQKVVDNNRHTGTGGGDFQGHFSGSSQGVTNENLDVDAAAPAINNLAAPNLSTGVYDYVVGFFNKNVNEAGIELFWTPAGGTRQIIPLATGGDINFDTNTVTVSGNSGLQLNTRTTMPDILLNNGSTLTVSGQPLTMTQTTIDGTAQVNMETTVNLGNIVPSTAGAPWTLIKGGTQTFTASGPSFSGLSSDHGVGVAGGRLVAQGGKGAAGTTSIGSAKIVLSGGTFSADSGILETPGAQNTLTEYWYHTNGNIPETSIEPPDGSGGLLRIVPTGTQPLTQSLVQFGDDPASGDTVDINARWGRLDQVAALWFGEWTFTGGAAHGNQYTFASKSDDGSAIWIDLDNDGRFEGGGRRVNDGTTPNEMILDNNDYQGDEAFSSLRTIPDGTYRVALGWYEGGGGATSSYKWQRGDGSWGGNNVGLYDSSPTLLPIDPTVSTVAASRGRSFDLNAETGNASFQDNAVEVIGGTTTLEANGPSRFGAMTFTNTATVNTTGARTSIASVNVTNGTGTLNNGVGANNLALTDVGAEAGATLLLGGNNNRVTGSLTGGGTVAIGPGGGILEFTGAGATAGATPSLAIQRTATPNLGAVPSVMRFSPAAGTPFAAAGAETIENEGILHAASGVTDLSGAISVTTSAPPAAPRPGLLEITVSGGFNTGPVAVPADLPGATYKLELTSANTWDTDPDAARIYPANSTQGYFGEIFIPDTDGDGRAGPIAFGEHFDDGVLIKVDGQTLINNNNWDIQHDSGEFELPEGKGPGWYAFEARLGRGGGPNGPQAPWAAGDPPMGFGIGIDTAAPFNPQGSRNDTAAQGGGTPADLARAAYVKPEDNGSMNLFRFALPTYGQVQVDSGATLKLGAIRGANAVNLPADARLELHGGVSKINASALSIAGTPTAPTATLDVTDAGLALDFPEGGPSPGDDVRARIVAARGNTDLIGAWDGKGITSSSATNDPASFSVGSAVNSDLPLGPYAEFGGVPVDPSTVIIRGTRIGDANLDGIVGDDDVTIVGATFGMTSGATWALGDFTYDGAVNDDDVTLLGALYNPNLPPLGFETFPAAAGAVAAVPEPATWLMLTLGGLGAGLFGWRRRRK